MQKQESRRLKRVWQIFRVGATLAVALCKWVVAFYEMVRTLLNSRRWNALSSRATLVLCRATARVAPTVVSMFLLANVHAQSGEVNLLHSINPSNPSSKIWQLATSSAYPIAVGVPAGILIAGYLQHDKDLELKGWKIVGALAVNTIIAEGLKYGVNRERPYEKYPLLINAYDNTEKGQSFPSGHTSEAFAMAASLSIECKKWYVVVPAYTYATAVGYSRLYLGEHYPTDVLAGAAIGVGSAYLSNWLQHKFFKTK